MKIEVVDVSDFGNRCDAALKKAKQHGTAWNNDHTEVCKATIGVMREACRGEEFGALWIDRDDLARLLWIEQQEPAK